MGEVKGHGKVIWVSDSVVQNKCHPRTDVDRCGQMQTDVKH